MAQDIITLTPPTPTPPGAFWLDVSTVGTPLAGIAPGTPVTLNPASQTGVNLTTFGLIVAYVKATDVISFGIKLLSAPVDVLVSTP